MSRREFEAGIGEHHRVAKTTVGRYWVSTVRLPTTNAPYETMVCDDETGQWLDRLARRYTTEEAAREGHAETVLSLEEQ